MRAAVDRQTPRRDLAVPEEKHYPRDRIPAAREEIVDGKRYARVSWTRKTSLAFGTVYEPAYRPIRRSPDTIRRPIVARRRGNIALHYTTERGPISVGTEAPRGLLEFFST